MDSNVLKRQWDKSVLLLLHHHHDVIKDYFKDGKAYGLNITYSIEEKPRGTAGAIFDNLPSSRPILYNLW